jgi:glycerophosphoryl diester phosphodiesterase
MHLIGHRGAAAVAPENTLAGIRQGLQDGADGLEIDVRLSKDGRIVVIHDADTGRTTGQPGRVAEQTLAELQRLDAGSWKGPAWAGEKIPTLESVLAAVPGGKRLLIEVKCGPEVLGELERLLAACGRRPEETAVISFDLPTIRQAKQRMPRHPAYWIQGTTPRWDALAGRPTGSVDELIETCQQSGLDGLSLAYQSEIARRHVDRLRELGGSICVWTVNDADAARRLLALGVETVVSDCPAWLRAELAGG